MLASRRIVIGRPAVGRLPLGNVGSNKYWRFIHHWLSDSSTESESLKIPEGTQGISKLRRLEAVLFIASEGLSSRKLAKLAGLADATEARTLIRRLNELYAASQRAFRIEEVAGGYAFLTSAPFASWLRKIGHVSETRRLSQTMLETLAVVAYRQPVQRAEIEAIRGVGCSEVLKQLMESELVRITGRSEELGRPYLYGTTKRFLQMFGLRSVDRLPRMSWVNEPATFSSSTHDMARKQSEAGDSAMTHSPVADKIQPAITDHQGSDSLLEAINRPSQAVSIGESASTMAIEDADDFLDEGKDDEDFEDADYDDDDEVWDDDDDEEDDEEEEDDDLEEESEWEEVDDDDDGWVDDDDDDDDDDLWGDDDEEDDDEWD